MRELWARRIAFFTWLLVLLLAAVFAFLQNPGEKQITGERAEQALSVEVPESNAPGQKPVEAGRQVYNQQGCARCHSIAGKGNPGYPLDGVGARHTSKELMGWITGTNVPLPAHIIKLKQSYARLPDKDLQALVIYLQSLR